MNNDVRRMRERVARFAAVFGVAFCLFGKASGQVREEPRVPLVPPFDVNARADEQNSLRFAEPIQRAQGFTGTPPPAADFGRISTGSAPVTITGTVQGGLGRAGVVVFDCDGAIVQQDIGDLIDTDIPPDGVGETSLSVVLPPDTPPGTYFVGSWSAPIFSFDDPAEPFGLPTGSLTPSASLSVSGNELSFPISVDGDAGLSSFIIDEPCADPTGVTITTRMTFDLDTAGSTFDTELGLFTEEGSLLGSNDQSGPGDTSLLPGLNLSAGRYFASISGFSTVFGGRFLVDTSSTSAPGGWELNVNGILVEAGNVTLGEFEYTDFVVRNEGPGADIAEVRSQFETVTIQTLGDGINTEIAVFDADTGDLIARNDDSGIGQNARLDLNLMPGDYVLAVNPSGTEYGDGFTTIVNTDADPFLYELSYGVKTIRKGTINEGGDTDFFNFTIGVNPIPAIPEAQLLDPSDEVQGELQTVCAGSVPINAIANVIDGSVAGWTISGRTPGGMPVVLATGTSEVPPPGGPLTTVDISAVQTEGLAVLELDVATTEGATASDAALVRVNSEMDVASLEFVTGTFDVANGRLNSTERIGGRACIFGSVIDRNAGQAPMYRVDARLAGTADPFFPVDPGSPAFMQQRENQPLVEWQTETVPDGVYEVRLEATNECGDTKIATTEVLVDNTDPIARLDSPDNCSFASDVVQFFGDASDDNLTSWRLEYFDPISNAWETIATDTTSAVGLIANWDVSDLEPCSYLVRLRVNDGVTTNCSGGRVSQDFVAVEVGCSVADIAAPLGVLDGGDVNAFISGFGAGCR